MVHFVPMSIPDVYGFQTVHVMRPGNRISQAQKAWLSEGNGASERSTAISTFC